MVRFRRRDRGVPAPLTPPTQPAGEEQIMIPFEIAEQTRVFINLLTKSKAIPEEVRDLMSHWLYRYSEVLVDHIIANYGHAAVIRADEDAKAVAAGFYGAIREVYTDAERDLFERLEKEFNDE